MVLCLFIGCGSKETSENGVSSEASDAAAEENADTAAEEPEDGAADFSITADIPDVISV